MSIREYVGARYVPKFMGVYSITTNYEALCVVDDGLGTSYTSKIPVPAGTPLTNTTYWAQTGSLNGAIINLQNQIDDINNKSILNDVVTPEMFGAVGDGVTDDSEAIANASAVGTVYGGDNTYYIGEHIILENSLIGGKFKVAPTASIKCTKNGGFIFNSEFYNSAYPSDRGQWLLVLYQIEDFVLSGCIFRDGCNALYLDHCKNAIISNNIFKNLIQNAVNTGGNGYGVLTIESENIKISNNNFIDVARHSIYLSHESGTGINKSIFITENTFKWTTDVVGNTSGFEITMMIRPSKDVYIENNVFEDMYGVCDLYRETVTINNVNVIKACENVYIKNNVGFFNFQHRSDGVIYLDGNSSNNLYESHKNIYVENNNFRVQNTCFIKVGNFSMLRIKGNTIQFLTGGEYYPLVYCETPATSLDDIRNLIIEDNHIDGDGTNGNSLIHYVYGSDSNVRNHGLLSISNNILRNMRYLMLLGGANSRSFSTVTITNNTGDFRSDTVNSNNMNDASVTSLICGKNNFNTLVPLRCAEPSNVPVCDCVTVAFNTATAPADSVLGSLYRDANTSKLLMKTPTGWSEI